MHILFPGRHHLLTDFQYKYLARISQNGLFNESGVDGKPLKIEEKVESIIFAVTSANHSNTRRNPAPFHLRSMAILDFCQDLEVPAYVFGIDDVGWLEDFASYTLKKIKHESEGLLDLSTENTVLACSSPVHKMYKPLGFNILPVELEDPDKGRLTTESPWDLVELISKASGDWRADPYIFNRVHQSSFLIWKQYRIGEKVKRLFSDDMIGADGDLTETRDYNSYVRQMDEIAELKYEETAAAIRPGRIGDIGCAVGTWIKLACQDPRFRESDFYGIEVARQLYNICLQRKENGEFSNPFVFFAQKNAVTGLCFEHASMNTIHSSSLTHEIESYGSREDLISFIRNRFDELAPGGVWINRDVIGPENGDRIVLMKLNDQDGRNNDWESEKLDKAELREYLTGLSTKARFLRFARDFRKGETGQITFEWEVRQDQVYARLSLRDAMEFISKKDYVLNWASEMHEKFCFWSFSEWKNQLERLGFSIAPASVHYTNEWLVTNRYEGKVELFADSPGLPKVEWPDTHMVMVAEKHA